MPQSSVYALATDSAGFLWVATADGLARFDGYEFRTWRARPGQRGALPHATVRRVFARAAGVVVATDGGWCFYDPVRNFFQPLPTPKAIDLTAAVPEIRLRAAGTEWRATASGLLRRPANNSTGGRGWHPVVPPPALVGYRPRALAAAPDGALWIGTDAHGLWRYTLAADRWEQPRGGPAAGITHLLADPAGTLWIGTDGAGLWRIPLVPPPFDHHTATGGSDGLPPLPHPFVTALWAVPGTSRVYVGTLGHGVVEVDRAAGTINPLWGSGRAGAPLADCTVRVIQEVTGDSSLLLGTNRGLWRYRGGQLRRIPLANGASVRADSLSVNALVPTRAGGWLVSSKMGLRWLNPATSQLDTVPCWTRWGSMTVFEDRAGYRWVGTYGNGAWWLPGPGIAGPARPRRLLVRAPSAERLALARATVRVFYEDAAGYLWLATDQGLWRVNPRTGATRGWREAEGLPSACVFSLLPDAAGMLWVGTSAGLARFDPRAGRVVSTYGLADGLPGLEFNTTAACRTATGELLLGGPTGYAWITPARLHPRPLTARPALTELRINGELWGDSSYRLPAEMPLTWRQTEVAVTFAAPGLPDPAGGRYRYQLVGADLRWVEAGGGRQARYVGLSPGAYALRVRAGTLAGAWGPVRTLLRFRIRPPWWQQPLVLAGAAALALLTLSISIRQLTTQRLRARVRELERHRALTEERARIAQDMHDDLGSGLSRLLLLSEVARRAALTSLVPVGAAVLDAADTSAVISAADPPEAAETIAALRRHLDATTIATRELLERIGHIVWALTPEHDHFGGFVAYLREYATDLLEAAGLVAALDLPDPATPGLPPTLPDRLRRNLFLLVKEALHNVVKHAQARRVTIRLCAETSHLTLWITDDGIGFDSATTRAFGQGLKNLHRRAADSGGTLVLESAPGRGTRLTVRVPLAAAR